MPTPTLHITDRVNAHAVGTHCGLLRFTSEILPADAAPEDARTCPRCVAVAEGRVPKREPRRYQPTPDSPYAGTYWARREERLRELDRMKVGG